MINKRGFTIVEALAALAISTVVGAAMWSLIQNALSSSNQFVDKQEFDEAIRQTQYILMHEQTCAKAMRINFGGSPFGADVVFSNGTGNVDMIVRPGTPAVGATPAVQESILLQVDPGAGTPIYYGRIKITNMILRKTVASAQPVSEWVYKENNPTPLRVDSYMVNLEISAANRRDQRTLAPKSIPMKIYVNPTTNTIENCFVTFEDNQTCASFGGTFNSATGICQMGVCNATVARATLPASTDCPPRPTTGTCSSEVYYWGFRSDYVNPAAPSQPVCLCARSCSFPPSPPPY